MAGTADVHKQHHSVGFNLAVIAIAVFAVALSAAYALDAAGRSGAATPGGSALVTRTLGGQDLRIPAAWFRNNAQPVDGFAKEIDLRLDLPLGRGNALTPIDVTLTQRSRARPSASLLDGVYLHQFLPDQLSGPPGLVGKPLRPDDGFSGETVWYDALAPNPFVAKCSSPVDPTQPSRCLRTVYLAPGVAAIYAFGSEVLPNWRRFDTTIAPALKRIGAL